MNDSAANKSPEKLLKEVAELVKPRTPAQLAQDATGLFLPGFAALPAVSIVSARPSRSAVQPERFATGQLHAFETEGDGEKRPLLTFFTPLENAAIPPVAIAAAASKARNVSLLQVEPRTAWDDSVLRFAWLPWGFDEADQGFQMDAITRISGLMPILASKLQATLIVDEIEIPLNPLWGLESWVPSPAVESILFPLNYARSAIEPFCFRLRIARSYDLPSGVTVAMQQKSFMLRFLFPEEELIQLYRRAGFSTVRSHGFSVVGNAIPMMNLDLKAWEPDTAYKDFVKTSNMKPLGFAGIVAFKQSREFISNDDVERAVPLRLPHATQFSIELSPEGKILSRYNVFLSGGNPEDSQLLFWMTYGEEINGSKFRYSDAEQIQPMQVISSSLQQALTLTPCFGGFACGRPDESDLYESLMLNYGAPPQMLLYRDSLRHTVVDLLSRLGYGDHAVREPAAELRVVGGQRRRVTVVHIQDNASNPLNPAHIKTMQNYIDHRAPIGSTILLEVI